VKFLLEGINILRGVLFKAQCFCGQLGEMKKNIGEYVENSGISSDQRLVGRIVSLLK
jgi:hypothetical protein